MASASSRLQLLKAISGSTWGHNKECLLVTFKTILQPILHYASAIWFPNASTSAVAKLQRIQNSALRIVTGCHRMASLKHLHSETKVLPVADHLGLLSKQFLASAKMPLNPSHTVVSRPPGPRDMKATLSSKFSESLSPYLRDGVQPSTLYKDTLSKLHTVAIEASITDLGPNDVIGRAPPDISEEEKSLDRANRCTLSQLRSGYCYRLNSYRHKIQCDVSDICPECHLAPHSTAHLFECVANPTNLETKDLWTRPREVARFLSSTHAFSHLLPANSPPPA